MYAIVDKNLNKVIGTETSKASCKRVAIQMKLKDETFEIKEVDWVDRNHKGFLMKEIDDDYLKHIAYFVAEGGGWSSFINETVIDNIFKECYTRKIMRPDVILLLHLWSSFIRGYSNYIPKYQVDWEGNYIKY